MAGFAEWQMEPAVAAALEHLGWRADEPEVRDAVPAVLRGGNVVAVMPPVPAWSTPILAGLLGRQPVTPDSRVLVLAAPSQLGEWAMTVGALIERTGLQVDVARELASTSSTRSNLPSAVVIASPESALERHARSALHPEEFRAVLFAWPEQWQADDAVAALLQDIPRDAQRVVLTTRRDQLDGADGVIERYARKALVVAAAPVEAGAGGARVSSVRTVPTSWAGRAAATAALLDALNAPTATIWTADERDHQLIHRTLGSLPAGLTLASRSVPGAGTTICYDLPTAAQLAHLTAVADVVLLVPPGCEAYVARIAPAGRPLAVNPPAGAVVARDAALRQLIGEAIAGGEPAAALYALAPLFERFDPQLVAAALFRLWQAGPASTPHPAVAPPERAARVEAVTSSAVAKIWIGAGKKDDATVADFVAVLVREVGLDRSRIGRIELRDTFALVEVPAADAEAIVQRLSGITIRRRKLTARVDQGRGPSRGFSRGP